jgi:hypothetical protein
MRADLPHHALDFARPAGVAGEAVLRRRPRPDAKDERNAPSIFNVVFPLSPESELCYSRI